MFESDLSKSKLVTGLDQLASLSVDELAEVYDSELVSLIDKHCPVVKRAAELVNPLRGLMQIVMRVVGVQE